MAARFPRARKTAEIGDSFVRFFRRAGDGFDGRMGKPSALAAPVEGLPAPGWLASRARTLSFFRRQPIQDQATRSQHRQPPTAAAAGELGRSTAEVRRGDPTPRCDSGESSGSEAYFHRSVWRGSRHTRCVPPIGQFPHLRFSVLSFILHTPPFSRSPGNQTKDHASR